MDIYDMLIDDHRIIDELLDELIEGDEFEPQLFHHIHQLVLNHSLAEDEIVYATLAREPEAATLIEESRQDHQGLEGMLEQIAAGFSDGDDWTEKVDDLQQLFIEHIEFEENELIPVAQRIIDDEHAEQLGERFHARKESMLSSSNG